MNKIYWKFWALLLAIIFFSYGVNAQTVIALYPQNNVIYSKVQEEGPTLTYFKPAHKKSNIAVIVCSGGSYHGRANNVEGIPACKKLNELGISAFLLDYRVPNAARMDHKEIVPLTDAQKAIIYLRENASAYKIDLKKIGIMGFSAGGHLVTTVETHFNQTVLDNPNHISLRPDFVVAVYPVVSFADSLTHLQSRNNLIGPDITAEKVVEFSNELHVTDKTPPTFIVAAIDDKTVKVQNSLYLEAALRQHRVPVRMFLYAAGGHGFGVDRIKNVAVQWTEPCFKWIRSEKWLNH